MSQRNAEGHAAAVLYCHVVSVKVLIPNTFLFSINIIIFFFITLLIMILVKVIAMAMQTAKAASDAALTTAKEGSFTMETTAAQTSAMEGAAAALKNILVGRVKGTVTETLNVWVISDVDQTTATERSLTLETTAALHCKSVMEETAAALKNILAGRVKEIVTAIPSVEMASSVEQTIARKGQPLATVTTAVSRSAPLGLTAKTGRVSLHAPPLEAQQEAWSASSPSNTKVRKQKGLFFQG